MKTLTYRSILGYVASLSLMSAAMSAHAQTTVSYNILAYVYNSGSMSFVQNSSYQTTELSPSSYELYIPEFDNSSTGAYTGDSLTNATVNYTYDLESDAMLTNNSTTTSSGVYETQSAFSLTSVSPTSQTNPSTTYAVAATGYSLAPSGMSGSTEDTGELYGNASNSMSYTSGSDLSAFSGSGDVVKGVSTTTQSFISSGGGNVTTSQVTAAKVLGTVTYTYTMPATGPTPEPPSAILTLFSLAGCALYGLRSGAKSGLLRRAM